MAYKICIVLKNRIVIDDNNKHSNNNNNNNNNNITRPITMVIYTQNIDQFTNFNLSDERPQVVVRYL